MSQEIVHVIREKDGPIHVTPPLTVRSGFVSERICKKVSKKGGVGGPVALASGYENTYPLPNRPE